MYEGYMYGAQFHSDTDLAHHGVKGMEWGKHKIKRYEDTVGGKIDTKITGKSAKARMEIAQKKGDNAATSKAQAQYHQSVAGKIDAGKARVQQMLKGGLIQTNTTVTSTDAQTGETEQYVMVNGKLVKKGKAAAVSAVGSGRQKNVTGTAKEDALQKRGEGLGTGPVGSGTSAAAKRLGSGAAQQTKRRKSSYRVVRK